MKKAIAAIIVAVVIIGGGSYLIFHKSSKSNTSGTQTSSNTPAVNNAVLITKTASGIGQYLADPSGKTLYTYNGDTSGTSNVSGSLLTAWPAYIDKGSTSNLPTGVGTIKRTDNGQTQYTYNGLPLYYFVSDSSGQVTGNNVQNFVVAKPAASSTSASPAPASNNSTTTPQPSTSPSYNY